MRETDEPRCLPLARPFGSSISDAAQSKRATRRLRSHRRALLVGVCAATVVIAIVATLLITRSITRALGAEPTVLSELTGRIANGDLRPVDGGDQVPPGSVLASISRMQNGLVNLVDQVRMPAESIASGSSEIAAGGTNLSSRTAQQVSSFRKTAASIEQLTSAVRRNAQNAHQANALATNAAEVTHKGSQVVGEVIETMNLLGDSSSRITDITGIIEGMHSRPIFSR